MCQAMLSDSSPGLSTKHGVIKPLIISYVAAFCTFVPPTFTERLDLLDITDNQPDFTTSHYYYLDLMKSFLKTGLFLINTAASQSDCSISILRLVAREVHERYTLWPNGQLKKWFMCAIQSPDLEVPFHDKNCLILALFKIQWVTQSCICMHNVLLPPSIALNLALTAAHPFPCAPLAATSSLTRGVRLKAWFP